MRHPRAQQRRLSPMRILILCNLVFAASIYGLVQWRFSETDSRAVRLGGGGQVSTEQELRTSAQELELMAVRNKDRDKELRAASPPVDWDALSNEGADAIAADWDAVTEKVWFKQPGFHLSFPEEDPPYPFQRIKLIDGKDTGIVAIIAPFYDTNYYRAEAARALFWRLKAKGHVMIGITSYQDFPGTIVNPYDDRHTTPQDEVIWSSLEGWLHCFREPDKVLPRGVPRIYLSESDFHDADRNDGGGSLVPLGATKEYDLVYSNQGGDWNDFARNWTLAKASIKLLIHELDLKVLILGRDLSKPADADLQKYIESGKLDTRPPNTPWRDFLKLIESARVLFAPNVHDASPRVLAEALCLNVPIVVNSRIVGGWKYVNEYTGEFFEDTTNVVAAFKRLFSPERQAELFPRDWFKATWGKTRSSYKLQAFMEGVVGEERLKTLQRDLAAARQS